MVGIIIALYEEGYELIKHLSFTKINNIPQYIGTINNIPVSLILVSPGIFKPNKLKQWIELHSFDKIINIGLAGSLIEQLNIGNTFIINKCVTTVIDKSKKHTLITEILNTTQIHIPEATLYTASKPIFTSDEKYEIYVKSNAIIVDMELYKLIMIIRQTSFPISNLVSIKIVGDTFIDHTYLNNEIIFRPFFTTKSNIIKIKIIIKMGIFSFIKIYKRKRYLQKKILHELLPLI